MRQAPNLRQELDILYDRRSECFVFGSMTREAASNTEDGRASAKS